MVHLRIAIIGAGIGGPAAAIGLARNGHKVTIYERSTSTSSVGYAFRITPNSDLCLKDLGIDTVAGGAVEANTVRGFDINGNVVRDIKEKQGSDFSQGGKSVFAYRPQLHKQLMDAALASGVQLVAGKKVLSVDTTNTSFVLDGGEVVDADVIIGADGIRSVIRNEVTSGINAQLKSSGVNCFRFTIPKSRAMEDPILSSVVSDEYRMFTWSGNQKMILVYPVDFNKLWNVTCIHPAANSNKELSDGEANRSIDYDQIASFETVMSIYEEFDEAAKRLLSLADKDGFRVWTLSDMDEIPNWSKNNVVLLGDACHPVLPSGYSGASMAIEDAVTLSTVLTPDIDQSSIVDRMKLYESIRRPRVQRVRQTARDNRFGNGDPAQQAVYREFLFSHDAITHAKQALKKHQGQT